MVVVVRGFGCRVGVPVVEQAEPGQAGSRMIEVKASGALDESARWLGGEEEGRRTPGTLRPYRQCWNNLC